MTLGAKRSPGGEGAKVRRTRTASMEAATHTAARAHVEVPLHSPKVHAQVGREFDAHHVPSDGPPDHLIVPHYDSLRAQKPHRQLAVVPGCTQGDRYRPLRHGASFAPRQAHLERLLDRERVELCA